jgi:hypothetical protein
LNVELMTVGLTKLVLSCAVLLFPDVGAAKLSKARDMPAQQRLKAAKKRGLKRPDLEVRFLFFI